MAEQMLQPPAEAVTPVQKLAAQAVAAFRDYIYTGNPQKKNEFSRIYDANPSQDFANAMAAELKGLVAGDRALGPAMEFYRNANGGRFYASEFMTFADAVRDAVVTNSKETLDALRDTAMEPVPGFVKNVTEPLLKACKEGVSPARQAEVNESAVEAAGMFMGLIETVRVEPGREYTMKEQAESRDMAKSISRDMLQRFRANAAEDGAFQAGFIDTFEKTLNEQSPQGREIVAAFIRDMRAANPQKALAYDDFAGLVDRLPKLFVQLTAPGYEANYNALARAYGSRFTDAVRAYVISVATPVQEVASTRALAKRLAEIEKFVSDRGLESVRPLIADWKKRLAESPDRDTRLGLHEEIPGLDELMRLDGIAIQHGKTLRAVLDGREDYYRTIGTKVWVPRLETITATLKDAANQQLTGKFMAALLAKEHIDIPALENLAVTARTANLDIQKALAALDELLVATPLDKEDARHVAIAKVFGKAGERTGPVNRAIDDLTDRLAAFGLGKDRETLRREVSGRLMMQFVAATGVDHVDALRARYEAMGKDREFIAFRNGFTSDIDRHISALSATAPTLSGERLLKESRQELATKARQAFGNIQLEYAYGIYGLLRQHYGRNWSGMLVGNEAEMAKVCALINELSALPAPYASMLLATIGDKLLGNYDDASIAAIASFIAGSSQMFVNGDYQNLLIEYYSTLPDRLAKLFTDITAIQAAGREQGYDVRVRTPAEDPKFAEIFLLSANIRVRVPKRVYEEWASTGILQVARGPALVEAATGAPAFLRVMGIFMGKPMVEGSVNLPLPYLNMPILLRNIGDLAPDLPPVGRWIAANVYGNTTTDHEYALNKTTGARTSDNTTTTINVASNLAREGATTNARASYSISEGMGVQTRQVGSMELQNLRTSQNYNVNTGSFDFEQAGTRLETIGSVFSAIAPKGAETFMLFRRNENAKGEVSLTAHAYQRMANGSFILSDAATLSEEQAAILYAEAFERPMQRLYGGAGVRTGDALAQMDGAVLFSGPWTSDYTAWDQFQGAGAAAQVGKWGGYADYEQTRGGRAAGAFGRFMPDKRSFWVGRLTAENVRVEADGKSRFYGEFSYLKNNDTEVRSFIGLAKNMTADDLQGAAIVNHMFGRDYMGVRYGGFGLGRLLREAETGREALEGGKIYGVSRDMLNGMVASTLIKTFTETTQSQSQVTVLSQEAQAFYDQNLGLSGTLRSVGANVQARQRLFELLTTSGAPAGSGITIDANNNVTLGTDSAQWLRTYAAQAGQAGTQAGQRSVREALVSAGVRRSITNQLGLEAGTGWDVLNDKGAAFMNFDWTPLSYDVADVGLRAYVMSRDKRTIPIIGGIAELTPLPRTKFSGEAHFPGIGEFRLRSPVLELSIGGGRIKELAEGWHAGVSVPLGSRWTLGAATSFSTDYLKDEAKRLDQQEGIAGVIFTMPYSDKAGFRLANVFASGSFIHQNQELLRAAYGEALQWDANAGLNWLTSNSSLTGQLGTQYWESAKEGMFRADYSLTAGVEYTMKAWMLSNRSMLMNPAASADFSIGTLTTETAEGKDVRVNWRANFKIGAEF
ncbi:MAG: hypothetical protein PHV13_02290 [Candidatus ainarchaeum sp.]|nr:hypothetical protein [Candidatus ainarchaeum sp.]